MDVSFGQKLAVGATVFLITNAAFAAEPAPAGTPSTEAPPMREDALEHVIARPHTIAEIEGGIIALPGAPISASQRGGDTPIVGKIGHGDATVQTGIHVLYRFRRDWIVGAGAIFAPAPTADKQYGGLSSLSREHSRSYFFLGLEARYVPLRYKSIEGWVGVSGGGVVVADRFHTDAPAVPPILGYPDVNLRSEGFGIGLQGGVTYYLSDSWIAGANLRGYEWVLPSNRECSPIGDCATLSGSVQAFELGITIGYRLPL